MVRPLAAWGGTLCLFLFAVSCGGVSPQPDSTQGPTPQILEKGKRTSGKPGQVLDPTTLTPQELNAQFNFDPDSLEPGEVCVINNSEADAAKLDQFALAQGFTKKKRRTLEGLGFVMSILEVPKGQTVAQGIHVLRQAFPADIIDANHRYTLQSATRDLDPRRYGFQIVGWNERVLSCGKEPQKIGMIDTSINRSHPLLQHQRIHTKRFLSDQTPQAADHHGTAVATLLIGQSPSHTSGLMPTGNLWAAESFRESRPGHVEATTWSIVRALDWLVQEQVHVINLSLGGPSNGLLTYAVDRTLSHHIPIVAAAGNGGPQADPLYPAAQDGVIAVTALDAQLLPYSFANRGAFITFSAPGVDIWVPSDDQKGVFKSGTSFAAPFVTTAAASLKVSHPHWTPDQVSHHLAHQAVDLGPKGKDEIFGWGLIQIPDTCATQPSEMLTKS